MPTWPLRPRMRAISCSWKPFITDITMIRVATPSAMPSSENHAMIEMNPSRRRARRYRPATMRSNGPKIMRLLREPLERFLIGKLGAFARRAVLQFDDAVGDALGADHHLPGQADQIHVGELDPGPLLAVVIENFGPEGAIELLAGFVAGGIALLEIDQADTEGGDRLRPFDAGLVVMRLDQRADQTRHANAIGAHLDGHVAGRAVDHGVHRL